MTFLVGIHSADDSIAGPTPCRSGAFLFDRFEVNRFCAHSDLDPVPGRPAIGQLQRGPEAKMAAGGLIERAEERQFDDRLRELWDLR